MKYLPIPQSRKQEPVSFEGCVQAGFYEILGEEKLNAMWHNSLSLLKYNYTENISKLQFSYAGLTAILKVIENEYGMQGAAGIAWRTGQAGFKYILRAFGPQMGLADMRFKLLPYPQKISFFMQVCENCLREYLPAPILTEPQEGTQIWGWELSQEQYVKAMLYWLSGFLSEGYYWLSGGKINRVEPCLESSTACKVKITLAGR